MVRTCISSLDDGLPRRKDNVTVFCSFLQPSGLLNYFHIPIHALTTSSSAERDFQLQSSLREITQDGVDEQQCEKIKTELLEVKNAQLRAQILSDIVSNENISTDSIILILRSELVMGFFETFFGMKKLPLEGSIKCGFVISHNLRI